MGSDELLKFTQQNKSFCFVVLLKCSNQECENHHAQQENFSLKLVANRTQSSPFIPLVLIVSELLSKSTIKERVKKLSNRRQILNKNGGKHVAISLVLCSRFAHAHYGSQMIDRFLYWDDIKGSCQRLSPPPPPSLPL